MSPVARLCQNAEAIADLEVICVKWTRPLWFGGNDTLHQEVVKLPRRAELAGSMGKSGAMYEKSTLLRRCQGLTEFVLELTPTHCSAVIPRTHRPALQVPFILHERVDFSHTLWQSQEISGQACITSVKLVHQIQGTTQTGSVEISAVVPVVASVSYNICLSIAD